MKSEQHENFWVIIPAAGKGLRMGASIPKQYLSIGEKTILEHTITKFANLALIQQIVVVIQSDDPCWQKLKHVQHQPIITAKGGQTRAQSVLNGLGALIDRAKPNDWVLVHDAVRPCIRYQMIEHLIESLANHEVGGLLGIPVVDTLKQTNAKSEVLQTISRDSIWCAQTPQMFRFQLLFTALRHAMENKINITDEASAIEAMGKTPKIITGDSRNIKITNSTDLSFAKQYLEEDIVCSV